MITIRKILLSAIIAVAFLPLANAQKSQSPTNNEFQEIYILTEKKYGVDQQLINGMYFEDVYRGAKGNPYLTIENGSEEDNQLLKVQDLISGNHEAEIFRLLNDNGFQKGSINYHNKYYRGVKIKYDIYEQQILIKSEKEDFTLTTILTNEFVKSFSIYDKRFRKLSFNEDEPEYYQLISDEGSLKCYYYWYKERNEILKDNDKKIYSFSGDKKKSYLFINNELSRYLNNRTFLKVLPEELKKPMKNYLKSNGIKVNKVNDQVMKEVIAHGEQLLISKSAQ